MTLNKKVVETYQASLGDLDWASVASCLTDDGERAEWADGFRASGVPVRGKAAVIQDMEAPRQFEIRAARMAEQNDVVVAECMVRVPLPEGRTFRRASLRRVRAPRRRGQADVVIRGREQAPDLRMTSSSAWRRASLGRPPKETCQVQWLGDGARDHSGELWN